MIEIITSILVILGAILTVLAGVGIVKLPDVYIRMHAATKVGTLGSGLIMAGAAVHFGDTDVVVRCVLIVFFLLLTAPIGAHMIGRAALGTGIRPWSRKRANLRAARAQEGAQSSDAP
ncbi:MAG: monovalent cation/H(+) antiporter subunit G [Pseudomonadota bacterium]